MGGEWEAVTLGWALSSKCLYSPLSPWGKGEWIELSQDRIKCQEKTSFLNLEEMRNLDCSFRLKNNVRNEILERSWLPDICLCFMEQTVRVEVSLKSSCSTRKFYRGCMSVGQGVRSHLSYRTTSGAKFWEDSVDRRPLVLPLDQGKKCPCPESQAQKCPLLLSLGYTGWGVWEAKGTNHLKSTLSFETMSGCSGSVNSLGLILVLWGHLPWCQTIVYF